LRALIGKICHVYLDDIIIWLDSLEEHKRNVCAVLDALRAAQLYCSVKKSQLFGREVDFLGHHISIQGIEADPKKVERIINWPIPTSATDVRAFLGLVHDITDFLPLLADHTLVLTPLTHKSADIDFPTWTATHQVAFDLIKALVVGRDCLTTINHNNMGDNKVFLTCCYEHGLSAAKDVLNHGPTRTHRSHGRM
jgi:Reverse transcriptase (RNA-dependent DNA polymerase)